MSATTIKGFVSVSDQIERSREGKGRIRGSDLVGAIPLMVTSVANTKITLYRRREGGFFTFVQVFNAPHRHVDFGLSRRHAEYQRAERAFFNVVRECAANAPLHHPKMPVPASN